ncbi:MAG: MFS transporter, partial [Geminicoccaceae bacterium]|nr:MFS transporter [Geminicoccaceae bacterium]
MKSEIEDTGSGKNRGLKAAGNLFAPLAETRFRQLWSANLLSNLGWLIQGVGAAWLMAELTSSPQMVALVQTMTQLPILLFALFAGTAGDLWEKRWVLMTAQVW